MYIVREMVKCPAERTYKSQEAVAGILTKISTAISRPRVEGLGSAAAAWK